MPTSSHSQLAISMVALLLTTAITPGCASSQKEEALSVKSVTKAPRLKIKWRAQVDQGLTWDYKPQQYATPFFVARNDELVVAASSGSLSRVRAGSGEVIWQRYLTDPNTKTYSAVHADPLVVDDVIYVATLDGLVRAVKLDTGEEIWRYQCEDAPEGTLAFSEGRLFVIDAKEVLYTLDAAAGELLWRYQRPVPEFFTIKGAPSASVDEGVVYAGFADGSLVGLNIDTGTEVWLADLSNEETEFIDVDTPVVVTDSSLYAASYSGGVFALSREDGAVKWRAPVSGVTYLLYNQGTLFVASATGRVMAIDTTTRQFLWSYKFKEHIPVELSLVGSYLFASTSSGPMVVLESLSGAPMTKWDPSGGFNSGVVFDKVRGFTLSNGGYLYAFELAY